LIKIERHVHGIAVSAEGGIDHHERTRDLERVLEGSFVSSGRLLVPLESAGAVFDILGQEDVVWDEEVLSTALSRKRHRKMQTDARVEVANALKDPYSVLAGYAHLHRLDRHQAEAVAAIVSPSLKGIAIFDEQGTGKTLMALAAFDWLRERGVVQRLLVVAPKSVLSAWEVQCDQFLDGQNRRSMLTGTAAARRRALLHPHDILLVGYEAAVASATLLQSIISTGPAKYLLIVDESYFVKNPATERAQVVSKLRTSCERAVVLCGTPAPNSPIDVVNQIDIADGGVAFGGRSFSKDPLEAYDEVADALQDAIYLRRLKSEVLPQIPPKLIDKIYLELSTKQRLLYDRAKDELMHEVRNLDERQFRRKLHTFLAKRMHLLQICSNPKKLDPLYNELPAKIRALDRLVKELVEDRGEKVVIWSYFRASLDEIATRYASHGIARIDGSIARAEDRRDAVARFQGDPNTRIFVGNAAAAGTGITLTVAHHAIYESFSNQAAHYLQSIDRIHRRGQTKQTFYHILIARATIEEREYRNLIRKERTGRELMGDHFEEPMTRERFLLELETTS
jgi:SNF2 family DNA or RNA helicase